jgi:hypothetical protein
VDDDAAADDGIISRNFSIPCCMTKDRRLFRREEGMVTLDRLAVAA